MKIINKRPGYFCLIIAFAAIGFIIFLYTTQFKISPPQKPYDKHIKTDASYLSKNERYLRDFDFLYKEIKNNYVNLSYKEEKFGFNWDELYEHYRESIEKAESEKEFYKISAEFVSNLKDGHLSFRHNSRDIRLKIIEHYDEITYPMDIRFIENKPIVVSSINSLDIIGDEVISINGVEFLDIIYDMKKYYYYAGNDISARSKILRYSIFYNYFDLHYDKFPDALEIKLRTKEGKEKLISLDSHRDYTRESKEWMDSINFGFYENSKLPSYKILDNNIGYILIPTFSGSISDIVDEFHRIVLKLKSKQVKGVIIDLRYNGGGNESFRKILGYLTKEKIIVNNYRYLNSERFKDIYLLRPFYDNLRSKSNSVPAEKGYTKWWSWVVKPNEEQFLTTAPVVVLSNELIFSSTDTFINTCLNYDLATVIGNMVPLSGHGLSTAVVLPSKNYLIMYGFYEGRDIDYRHMENVIKEPDIKVEQKLDDFYNGIDSQLNKAIEYISKER